MAVTRTSVSDLFAALQNLPPSSTVKPRLGRVAKSWREASYVKRQNVPIYVIIYRKIGKHSDRRSFVLMTKELFLRERNLLEVNLEIKNSRSE